MFCFNIHISFCKGEEMQAFNLTPNGMVPHIAVSYVPDPVLLFGIEEDTEGVPHMMYVPLLEGEFPQGIEQVTFCSLVFDDFHGSWCVCNDKRDSGATLLIRIADMGLLSWKIEDEHEDKAVFIQTGLTCEPVDQSVLRPPEVEFLLLNPGGRVWLRRLEVPKKQDELLYLSHTGRGFTVKSPDWTVHDTSTIMLG
jgi:hypothetical protein